MSFRWIVESVRAPCLCFRLCRVGRDCVWACLDRRSGVFGYPDYVFGRVGWRLGALRLCVGLFGSAFGGVWAPRLCFRPCQVVVGWLEIVCGVVGIDLGVCLGTLFVFSAVSRGGGVGRDCVWGCWNRRSGVFGHPVCVFGRVGWWWGGSRLCVGLCGSTLGGIQVPSASKNARAPPPPRPKSPISA